MNIINFVSAFDTASERIREGTFSFSKSSHVFKYVQEGRIFQSKKRRFYVDDSIRIDERGNVLSVEGADIGKIFKVKEFPPSGAIRLAMELKSGENFLIKDTQTFRDENLYQICFVGEKLFWLFPMDSRSNFARPLNLFPHRRFKKITKNLEQSLTIDFDLLLLFTYYLCLSPTLK